ncbi:ABC transporter ATP-binding protein [Caldisericum sp. AR60]|uniref:ABC transporter ATP-binding protein n=1 Tax=Caldisericum sp. AR60 TaxID=3397852 RepID=UPI0039FC0C69
MQEVIVNGVKVYYEGFLAVNNVSFTLHKGSYLSIIGPSGCGKTSLLKAIAGLLPYEGYILRPEGPLGYMPQKGVLLPWYTLLKNLEIPLLIRGINEIEARKRVLDLLPKFGLKGFENHFPNALSGGMYQRAALLRTLLTDSELLLLDEPFGAVDALNRRKLWLYLENMRQKFNFSTIMVTHDVEEAVFLSDIIVIIHKYPGELKEIVQIDLPHPRTLQTISTDEFSSKVEYVLEKIIEENN